ncbi:MAG TPA: hypothetical protein VNV38_06015 [Stellaceae bacterium]|jgi:hypothetical protein|nr:hypothetical protein [Stellaceae bacterium]
MLFAVTEAARRLERWLSTTFGRPYHALLAIGIGIELVQHCRELPEKLESAAAIKTVLALLLFLVLLVHQLGELSEHAEHRRRHD